MRLYEGKKGYKLLGRLVALVNIFHNVSYTFLNGMTNPLVDFIAKIFFTGYRNGTDLHYAKYAASSISRS